MFDKSIKNLVEKVKVAFCKSITEGEDKFETAGFEYAKMLSKIDLFYDECLRKNRPDLLREFSSNAMTLIDGYNCKLVKDE